MSETWSKFALDILNQKYARTLRSGRKETWKEVASRVVRTVMEAVDADGDLVKEILEEVEDRAFIPGGRYLYATGNPYHQTQNCFLLRVDDSREGWSNHLYRVSMALMTGGGVGVDYSNVRERGAKIRRTGGTASGPCALIQMTNEVGRGIHQGGDRRSALWAGLNWAHPDVFEFIRLKDWSPEVRAMKEKDYNFPAPCDGTNISVLLDDEFFVAYERESHRLHAHARKVYWEVIRHMLETGEPGFSVDVGPNAGETLRNACTEVTSADDDDVCNLGSINLARVRDADHMRKLVRIAVAFLIAGTVYSDVPYAAVDKTRTKNRRLGLGLMGVHEWLLQRGKQYGPDDELAALLEIYATSTEAAARVAKQWGLSRPVKTRAIAPNGTIGIVAETTTSGEPIFCVAYKRRYIKGDDLHYQYVVDPTARRLIDAGTDPAAIEDAYALARDVERRVAFQAWLQQYVDHGISSTINLPAWGSEENNEGKVRSFGNMLLKYLPKLRGITCYPDGARGGQPLTPVKYETAMKHLGEVVLEQADACSITKGGSCG